jgi:hypothetical protein
MMLMLMLVGCETDLKIAAHYEEAKDPGRAGTYYAFCRDFTRAVKLFLQCGEARIDDSINVVKKAEGLPERDTLSRLVQDFLLGEIDGKIKDPKYSYKLFMAVGDYVQVLYHFANHSHPCSIIPLINNNNMMNRLLQQQYQ